LAAGAAIAVVRFSLTSVIDWRAPLRMRTMTRPLRARSICAVRVSGIQGIPYTGSPGHPVRSAPSPPRLNWRKLDIDRTVEAL
jgi:hypothetical protein